MSHNGWLDPCETREGNSMAINTNKGTLRSEAIRYPRFWNNVLIPAVTRLSGATVTGAENA